MDKVKTLASRALKDSLFLNSAFLMASTGVMAGMGFLFWMINARLYDSATVGLATALISVTSLISQFSLLGLGNGLIRFLPASNRKSEKINSAFTLVSLTAALISCIFLAGITLFSPALSFVTNNPITAILLILFAIFTATTSLMENVFIAFRQTSYVLVKNTLFSMAKVGLPLLLVSYGAFGIYSAVGVATILAVGFSVIVLTSKYGIRLQPQVNWGVIKPMFSFSVANYTAGFIGMLPQLLLPVIIVNALGASYSAFFYVVYMIASFLYIIPMAASQSLFAEGSYKDDVLSLQTRKAVKVVALLAIPAVVGSLLWGNFVLLAFGKDYSSEGIGLLRFFSLATLFMSVNYFGNAVLNVRKRITALVGLNVFGAAIVLGLSALFISRGLNGLGLAWFLGQGITASFYVLFLKQKLN